MHAYSTLVSKKLLVMLGYYAFNFGKRYSRARFRNSCTWILLTLVFVSVSAKPDATVTTLKPHYAKNFEITFLPTHRIANVHIEEGDSTRLYQYALVPREAPLPELPKGIPVIRTPVERVVVLETIYIGLLEALGQLETIMGAGTADYISNPTVRRRIETGAIQPIQTGQTFNVERLMLLKPDLIFTSIPSEPTSNISAQLDRTGLPLVMTAEYKEHHPLGRAEWIRFIAAFFNASDKAEKTFATIAKRYEDLAKTVNTLQKRPTVFCGAPYSGTWHMAGGNSYMAQLIRDAGGNYLWNDITTANAIPLDFERVFLKAANADIWLNPGIHRSRAALFSTDPRFRKFRAAQTEHIYNNTWQHTENTGNPIWETGVVRPDNVLADLIKVFHPELTNEQTFIYYERLR